MLTLPFLIQFDDLSNINVNLNVDLPSNIAAAALNVMPDISVNGVSNPNSNNQGTPLTTNGLSFPGFTASNSTYASTAPNILFANASSTSPEISVTSPTVAFNLNSMTLGCGNGTTAEASLSLPAVPGGLQCHISFSGTRLPNSPAAAANAHLPNAVGEVVMVVGGPMIYTTFNTSIWTDLMSVSFTAFAGRFPVGVLMDNLGYALQGAC